MNRKMRISSVARSILLKHPVRVIWLIRFLPMNTHIFQVDGKKLRLTDHHHGLAWYMAQVRIPSMWLQGRVLTIPYIMTSGNLTLGTTAISNLFPNRRYCYVNSI